MNKSKLIFGIVAVCVIIACVLCFVLFGNQTKDPAAASPTTAPTTDSDNHIIIPNIEEQDPIDISATDPPVIVEDNVTIQQVNKDPNEAINRNPVIDPNHPEYLDIEETSPFLSAEGSVYRNDKVISIDIIDQQTGDICTFSFGHITGTCNRFLYLNPQFKLNGEPIDSNIYFKFDEPYGGGIIDTYGIPVEENIKNKFCLNYTFYRALEEKQVSAYVDPQNPGAFWFTQEPIENNVYIDVKAYYYQGGLFATLRLTVSKAEDGTYSIVDIDSKDMLTNGNNDQYSLNELAYIVELTDTTYHTPGAVHGYNSLQLEWKLGVEDCLIELRDHETGLYFNQFLSASGSQHCKDYSDAMIPILAVSYRWKGLPTQTMYFWVIQEPTDTTHGTYQFIGYDYPLYQTVDLLEDYGYEGNG